MQDRCSVTAIEGQYEVSALKYQPVVVFGASSLVGAHLLPQLVEGGYQVYAVSRLPRQTDKAGVTWHTNIEDSSTDAPHLSLCICLAPIWVLPNFFHQLMGAGVRRVVALSSTSVFTKVHSSDAKEQRLSQKITRAENDFKRWAQANGVEWVILRPTLVYGSGADKNVAVVVRFIKRFGFFPIYGAADGLRQPVHASDVARACACALYVPSAAGQEFNLSGAECLTYRDMVVRVFNALGVGARLIQLPGFLFSVGFFLLGLLPRYRHWSLGMALRMNQDQVCDHSKAASILEFTPSRFILGIEDLPKA